MQDNDVPQVENPAFYRLAALLQRELGVEWREVLENFASTPNALAN